MTVDYSAVQVEGRNQEPGIGSLTSAVTPNTPKLFTPATTKSVTLRNRIVVSPMCMDSARGGFFNDFHVAHYGSFALKGPGMIILEATAVEQIGQICINDAGIWSDAHIAPLKRIVDLIQSQGSKVALQLAHAGRKAGEGLNMHPRGGYHLLSDEDGGWKDQVVGPSTVSFCEETHAIPRALTIDEMQTLKQKWVDAAIRAEKAGVDVIEIHSAHGYLLHSFVSGNSNKRTDEYGGSLVNRIKFPLEVVQAVRDVWPEDKPLWVRLSATDWNTTDQDENGWDIYQSIVYAKALKEIGVDVIDVSSGGNLPNVKYPVGKHYQVQFAEAIKRHVGIATAAVGIITDPKEAEQILQDEQADYVLLGREFLRNSSWVNRAAVELGVDVHWNAQYSRAKRQPKIM